MWEKFDFESGRCLNSFEGCVTRDSGDMTSSTCADLIAALCHQIHSVIWSIKVHSADLGVYFFDNAILDLWKDLNASESIWIATDIMDCQDMTSSYCDWIAVCAPLGCENAGGGRASLSLPTPLDTWSSLNLPRKWGSTGKISSKSFNKSECVPFHLVVLYDTETTHVFPSRTRFLWELLLQKMTAQ